MAAYDEVVSKNYFKTVILKDNIIRKCLLCKEYEESIDHLILGWPISAKNEYIVRHDKIYTHPNHSMHGIWHKQKTGTHTYLRQCEKRKTYQYDGTKGHRQTDTLILANKPDISTKETEIAY